MTKAIVAIVCIALSNAAHADQYDVAARRMLLDRWQATLTSFYEHTAYLSFAYGCGIIKVEAQLVQMLLPQFTSYNRQAASMIPNGYNYLSYAPGFRAAGREGFVQSKIQGKCDYWQNHTQDAVELRAQANQLYRYDGPASAQPQLPKLFQLDSPQ